jgi:hypothetical protein
MEPAAERTYLSREGFALRLWEPTFMDRNCTAIAPLLHLKNPPFFGIFSRKTTEKTVPPLSKRGGRGGSTHSSPKIGHDTPQRRGRRAA